MSILARMRAKAPDQGYATDFVTHVMAPLARQIADKRIRVVANAGGVKSARLPGCPRQGVRGRRCAAENRRGAGR